MPTTRHPSRSPRPLFACILAGILTCLAGLAACKDKPAPPPAASTPPTSTPPTSTPPGTAPTPPGLKGLIGTDNAWCPIMPKKAIEPQMPQEWTREHAGKIIGFCCDECMAYWDTLDAQQRDEKLTGLMRQAPTPPAPR